MNTIDVNFRVNVGGNEWHRIIPVQMLMPIGAKTLLLGYTFVVNKYPKQLLDEYLKFDIGGYANRFCAEEVYLTIDNESYYKKVYPDIIAALEAVGFTQIGDSKPSKGSPAYVSDDDKFSSHQAKETLAMSPIELYKAQLISSRIASALKAFFIQSLQEVQPHHFEKWIEKNEPGKLSRDRLITLLAKCGVVFPELG